MSSITNPTDVMAGNQPAVHSPEAAHDRMRRRVSLIAAIVALAASAWYLLTLAVNHTIGAEVYGVIVAALAVVASVLSVALLASGDRRTIATVAVVVLWALVALGGLGGTAAHLVGPVPGHGPIDSRPRPPAAPLVFTAIGLVGGGALVYGKRPFTGRARDA